MLEEHNRLMKSIIVVTSTSTDIKIMSLIEEKEGVGGERDEEREREMGGKDRRGK